MKKTMLLLAAILLLASFVSGCTMGSPLMWLDRLNNAGIATAGNAFATAGNAYATDGNAFATSGNAVATNGNALATAGNAVATNGNAVATGGNAAQGMLVPLTPSPVPAH